MTLQELLDELNGNLVQGDKEWIVDAVSSAEKASAFDLAFADSDAAVEAALKSNAGTVVLKPGAAKDYPHGKCIVETDQPKLWFAKAAKLVKKPSLSLGIATGAVVAPDSKVDPAVFVGSNAVVGSHAWIGSGTRIGAGAIIGEFVKVGMECVIYPRVVIYPGVTLGDRVVVHAGAVLGADGFGYVRDTVTGEYTHFPQQGTLVIENDVEIGANSTIDRGALMETRIRKGTKIDNLVHVGHNCDVGENVILVALTGI
jgi:UDP-3-O-[3-hydroxymyristoyl] glucosamine N-acyltransferase